LSADHAPGTNAVVTANPFQAWLQQNLAEHDAIAGTVHLRVEDELELVAAVNIPDPVLAVVQRIPRGKGMAGLAFARNEPVSTCNLKTDDTGDVRPGARAVDAQAAVALPVHDRDGEVRATVGFAFKDERELTRDELDRLAGAAEGLPEPT
jgi:L-methionine (R)-S-oxide reductase